MSFMPPLHPAAAAPLPTACTHCCPARSSAPSTTHLLNVPQRPPHVAAGLDAAPHTQLHQHLALFHVLTRLDIAQRIPSMVQNMKYKNQVARLDVNRISRLAVVQLQLPLCKVLANVNVAQRQPGEYKT